MTPVPFPALVVLALVGVAAGPLAQQPSSQAGSSKPTQAQGAPSQAGAPPPPPAPYEYKSEGRRDPFVNLLGRGSDPRATANRPGGLAGVLINEIVVTGIVRVQGGFVATLRAPDNKTYIARTGERLLDGTIKTISETQVVFAQDVNDPLSLIKQREVPKSVRPSGESMESRT